MKRFSAWKLFWSMYLSLLCLEILKLFITMEFITYSIIGIDVVLIAIAYRLVLKIREQKEKETNL